MTIAVCKLHLSVFEKEAMISLQNIILFQNKTSKEMDMSDPT